MSLKSVSRWIVSAGLSVVLAGLLICGWGLVAYNSIFAVPAIAMGEVVMARPRSQVLGSLAVGKSCEASFLLTNIC